ncbi:LacI family DNA-binding transcriptional regulator [Aurantiacibacter sp. MUD61]|uniref:LacI family DNA-binding transcriptional regulator n=1 Tax=Aurantiacibacter sp. MUD61 TaxID=3009083 RepID=UPI0022F03001|nr:LacI family DNA-binding transcriptional regulator [Aurantiacibacter sp. MUD61]
MAGNDPAGGSNGTLTGMMKRSTITDVAKHAGVSIKTVSRVVRKEPNVSEGTRKVVEEAVAELNYRPTISARSTVSARSFLLGLVFDNPNPSYTFELLLGAQEAARSNGYHLIFEPLDRSEKQPGPALAELIIQGNLEGVIVPPPLCDDPGVLEALSEINRPFARIAPSEKPSLGFSVSMDDYGAAKAITNHLIDHGHTRIGFIRGRKGTATTRRRLSGYNDALSEAGLPFDQELSCQGDFQLRSGVECGNALLDLEKPPTAIFASNDDMAAGVMIAAHSRGLRVPEDLSIAGFDDSQTARAMWPPLTTIAQPVREMAAAAANAIIEHQRSGEGGEIESVELPFELIIRQSTGPAKPAE